MTLFLLVFLTLYGAMHALVFWGVHPLLCGHPALPSLTAGWMGVMVLAPVAVRLLDRSGHEVPARALAWVGYSWMGFVFLAACLFALLLLGHLAALLLARFAPTLPLLSPHRPAGAAAVLFAVLAVGLYGFHEASRLRVERVRLVTAKLPLQQPLLRIAQISDLHLGLLHREEALAPLVAALEELQPDLVVATGDIVDAQLDHLEELSGLWRHLQPPLGKYAVTGNHEFYAGLEQGLDFLRRSGFTVLRGESAAVGEALLLVGIDDPAGRGNPDELPLLRRADPARFTLLLKHRPLIAEGAAGLFDLQLSGHTHRGQIFPFNYLTALRFPLQDGLYELAGGSRLYTSRGTGTWGPPMRVGSPPEVTLFELVRQP
jgi:predicted MPP superfamily phosphohydrolase